MPKRDGKARGSVFYGLLTPSGTVVAVGTKRPKLTAEDRRDFWKVLRLRNAAWEGHPKRGMKAARPTRTK